ncbi:HD domain-containing protein [Actinoplanes aureus]|jgi:(p)ppGpp synthase/HD superfamily hydrolase|uniref:Bifunctional (P)ppGpp synthetase/guanosine-3',5'-bis(Diphosphate) 3'-pyrophosphohydrolase n=1 Tax=Actinoplanes aureus TaxID=2792083 RepID=A0A931G221_9ACTN|nr:HD domain-containing protein [Actinoplanes aureus]MBG0567660.1 bifunctional (p)ppGpp synthetase/guanosine-3',5'-bis(diphosphate) 3'-pyrophosphohydrolase [Actinoplanes aureus]
MAPRLLLSMPLHAITEVYGEAGLRDRFGLELESFPDDERKQLEAALDLASRLHADDRRVREPYLNHLLRVAIRIIRYYGVRDADVLTAALLHDAVEDHPAELGGLEPDESYPVATEAALTELARRFNPRVSELVRSVTNPEYDPARDRHEQYREHVAENLERDPWARVIKISDFTDNGVGVIHTSSDKAYRSATKYRPLVPKLRELVGRSDTPLSTQAKEHIFDQLDLAEERFAAILDD